ncbi:calcium/calmodulin-dependent protein kinase type IV isoform X1 [Sigmodon hispidus]
MKLEETALTTGSLKKKITRENREGLYRLIVMHQNAVREKRILMTPIWLALYEPKSGMWLAVLADRERFESVCDEIHFNGRSAAVKRVNINEMDYRVDGGVSSRTAKVDSVFACCRIPPENEGIFVSNYSEANILQRLSMMKYIMSTEGMLQFNFVFFLSEAPEILRGCAYGPEVDMWSVGIITYILLCGFEPFYDERGDQFMFRRILNCEYYFISPWWDEVSLNAKDLVRKLIVLDPKKRLNTFQALQHPWVTGKAANFVHMDTAQKKLQEFNARRKLKAAVKAVVASSRLGSASSSHTSIQESHKASPDPSQIQDANDSTALLGKKMQEGDQVAAEDSAAEMRMSQSMEEEKDAGVKDEEASRMVSQALEDGLKTDDPAMKTRSGEKLKAVEEDMNPKAEEEGSAVGLGVPQQAVILPEY